MPDFSVSYIQRIKAPDEKKASDSIRLFLEALGFDPGHPELQKTPQRVAKIWIEKLTSGYAEDKELTRGSKEETAPFPTQTTVELSPIHVELICPHHLSRSHIDLELRYTLDGTASPPGFGRITQIVNKWAHRLILQEDFVQAVADEILMLLGVTYVWAKARGLHECVEIDHPEHRDLEVRCVVERNKSEC